ncbi:MAG: DUF2141 domain-containing protein [Bacteroidales bacterium]|nr:MAG: DUF2141 domain-containing protein [Bacteroidales bacterium]
MKTLFILSILSTLLLNTTSGQDDKHDLTLVVRNIRNDKGRLAAQLLNEEELQIEGKHIYINGENASAVFHNIPQGKYAIRIFHDENKNGKMDFNWIKIPKEGYGFSGNPKNTFKSPDIEELLFELDSDKKITIKMIYIL